MGYLVRCCQGLTFDILMLTWWTIRAVLTLMLVFVFIRGVQASKRGDGEERDLCYRVKRRSTSRSGTSQNPQTPTPNQHQSQKHKSHVLIV